MLVSGVFDDARTLSFSRNFCLLISGRKMSNAEEDRPVDGKGDADNDDEPDEW